ncbi:hypothetical protein [Mucilaginibacter segetis]|uniref:Lipocalin-like domain-containing protein n=1 Tax=Mucilaginibacter segetis TaxID=2793071 RepID=A0A934PRH0_9SPHI|nr:hypothetical protein [Mucilaginibacter segetis]MBK0378102.1 hypothetical protein [Mucilaginibacter segetis]
MKLKSLLILVAIIVSTGCKGPGERNLTEIPVSPIYGTWKLSSAVTITKGDSVSTYPVKGQEMIKIINGTHFSFFRHDVKGGGSEPIYDTGAGTYRLTGDNYTENLQYCNYREWENHSFTFKVTFKGDTLIQKGIERIDSLNINREIVETYVKIK